MSQASSGEKSEAQPLDAEVQREIDEALSGQSIEQLVDQHPPTASEASGAAPQEFHVEMKRGRIAAIRGEDVFVELTGESKLQGVVPISQFDRPPRIGSIMDFVVDHVDESQGLMFLSREGAVSRATWEQLQRGAVTDARVVSINKGGLELEMIGGIRAFMPASQIDIHHVKDLESFVGQKLEGIVQEIDRKSKKVVLSRRQLLEQHKAQARDKIMADVEVGQIREGSVTGLVDFGAFVDLGGVDGLIHISDLSYSHVDKPTDLLKTGQQVKVKVLKIDTEKQRISLGLKQVEPDPWEGAESKYKAGGQISARVVRTTSFGAFVELEPGVEGLLPLSEMSWKRVHKAEDVVKIDEVLRLAVLSIEPAKHRFTLSLKQAQGDPWIGAERKYEKDSRVEGKVLGVTDFGAFVELETGVEGLVHISELADHRVDKVEDVLKVGDIKPFRVLEVSEDDRKIKLSLKSPRKHASPAESQPPSTSAPPRAAEKARTRKPRKDLKSGLGNVEGIGLGGLSLDDFK